MNLAGVDQRDSIDFQDVLPADTGLSSLPCLRGELAKRGVGFFSMLRAIAKLHPHQQTQHHHVDYHPFMQVQWIL